MTLLFLAMLRFGEQAKSSCEERRRVPRLLDARIKSGQDDVGVGFESYVIGCGKRRCEWAPATSAGVTLLFLAMQTFTAPVPIRLSLRARQIR